MIFINIVLKKQTHPTENTVQLYINECMGALGIRHCQLRNISECLMQKFSIRRCFVSKINIYDLSCRYVATEGCSVTINSDQEPEYVRAHALGEITHCNIGT